MGTSSVIFDIIRNKACIVCGLSFSTPRAGKLYCSDKCKQFAFYHKDEISQLQSSQKSINDGIIRIYRKEFEDYRDTIKKMSDYVNLKRKQDSTYGTFYECDSVKLKRLERTLPKYLKEIKIPSLSIEEWSFLKVLYPDLRKEEFLKLLSSFNYKFYQSLTLTQDQKRDNKNGMNPVQTLYSNHILKIVEGKIIFI